MRLKQVVQLAILTCASCLSAAQELPNLDFNRDAAGWRLGNEFRYSPQGGRNGSGGLTLERSNDKAYSIASIRVKVVPGKRYQFGGWVRTENVQGSDNGASIALEFYRILPNGESKYITGEYLAGCKGTGDWMKIEGDKIIPSNATHACISLYLRRKMTGKVWFDDLFVHPVNRLPVIYSSRPSVHPDTGVTLYFTRDGKPLSGTMFLRAKFDKTQYTSTVRNSQANLPLYKGSGDLHVELFDASGKELAKTTLPFMPEPKTKQDLTAVYRLDRYNRIIANGKPFMPIGIFTAGITEADMKLLKDSGINTIMPYSTLNLRLTRNEPPSANALRKVMDKLHSYGLKISPSLKDSYPGTRYAMTHWEGANDCDAIVEKFVTLFKEHPALLSYLANDEMPTSRLPELIARRRQLNTLDPYHPVWSVLYQFDELPMYGGSSDIIAVDPYPITPENPHSMARVDYAMLQAKRTGLPVWGVPQIMSWAAYSAKNPKDAARYPAPTARQMTAMFLLMAGHGAKGFILYKYEDLKHWTLPADNFKKKWPDVVNAVAALRELEPFIMSTRPVQELEPASKTGAMSRAFLFQDDAGKLRMVLCALGPGQASLRLPLAPFGKSLLSKFGNTRIQNGMIEFQGQNIDCDILEFTK